MRLSDGMSDGMSDVEKSLQVFFAGESAEPSQVIERFEDQLDVGGSAIEEVIEDYLNLSSKT